MKDNNQNGFTIIEGLLVVIAMTLIGFTGFYVYNANKNTNNDSSQSSEPTKKETIKKEEHPKDESLGWKEIISSKKALKMRVPDGWNLNNDPEQDRFISSLDPVDITYKKGQPPVITTDKVPGSDAPHRLTVGVFEMASSYTIPGSAVSEFVLSNGQKGEKAVGSQEDTLNGTGLIKTTKYEFKKNGKSYIVNYSMLQGDPDNSEIVEKAVKTLQF